ncbi:hypothetical protein KIPB_006374, partial [Kipferlia bialata]|eukprot:g6374.t1
MLFPRACFRQWVYLVVWLWAVAMGVEAWSHTVRTYPQTGTSSSGFGITEDNYYNKYDYRFPLNIPDIKEMDLSCTYETEGSGYDPLYVYRYEKCSTTDTGVFTMD